MSVLSFRAGRAADAPALVGIINERLPEMRYAGLVDVHEDTARKLFAQAAFRHGHTNDGGCWLEVAESDRGIEAFILGALARVYHIGTKLCAQDMFIIGRKDCAPAALDRLVSGYVDWAASNPRVADIHLSWSDALPDGSRFASVCKRRGFILCGENYRRTPPMAAKEAA